MAQNQNPGFGAGGSGFLQVLGIIYLIKTIRRRREQRRLAQAPSAAPSRRTRRHSEVPDR